MENKVFEANINALKKYNENLTKKIISVNSFIQNIELVQNSNNEYNLIVNGVNIHDLQNAELEARNIVDNISNINKQESIVVIFGLGLGYLLDEAYKVAKGKIILFEPNIEILRFTFELVELSKIIENIFITDNIKDLDNFIYNNSIRETEISISFLSSYWSVYQNEITNIAKEIEYFQGEVFSGQKMINEVGRDAINNTLFNLKHIKECSYLNDFKNCLKGKTALIASAGPSLGKNIETIKKYREKFVIFSVGASYKTLINSGIQPDFLSMIEPRNTIGQVEGLDTTNATLILEPYTHPTTWEIKCKNKILFLSKGNFLNDWLIRTLKLPKTNLNILGTVSYCSMLAATFMGADNIVLIGQDLAYSDAKCYAAGSAYEDLECVFDKEENKYKITPKNMDNFLLSLLGSENVNNPQKIEDAKGYIYTLNKNLYTVDGQNGEKLPTQTSYALFIKNFEDFAKQQRVLNCNKKLINSSIGGAQINGFDNIPLETVANLLEEKNAVLDLDFKKINTSELKDGLENLKNTIKSGISDFLELLDIVEKTIKEYKRRRIVNDTIEKFLTKIEYKNNLYRDKYIKYDNIVNYICLCFYTALNNIIRTRDIKRIVESQNEFVGIKNSYIDMSNEYIERIENIINKGEI